MTTSSATEVSDASRLRHQLVQQLHAHDHIRSAAVEHAFRTVPRHVFAPEVPLSVSYANDIVPTRHRDDGTITSSVSAPWVQAEMLEAARIRPGHRVLEIGSGGYNAALIAELTGPTGHVTTLDIDPVVTDRAVRFLPEAGYSQVSVVTADAERLPREVVPEGGFDAIVVTVDTWDLPWIDALADGGRLVAPLRLHGYHWAIGFTKKKGALHSDEPLVVCGFVAMQGDGAWNPDRRTVRGTGVHLSWEDGTPLSVNQLAPALTSEPTVIRTGVTVGGKEPFDLLMLYLAGALPGFCRLEVDPDGHHQVLSPPPPHWPAAAIVRGTSLARLAHERITDGDDGKGRYEFVVHGYGDHGHLVAREMAEQVEIWQRNHRGARCPLITARPAADHAPAGPDHAPHAFAKKHTRITVDWPVLSVSTAREPETANASALIYNDRGEYLLHLRDYFPGQIWEPGMWSLLGGGREPQDATLEHTVRRELAEEAGLDLADLTPFATEYATDDAGATVPISIYAGRWNGDARDLRLTEGVMLAWFPPDDLHRLRIADTTSDLVRRHAAGLPAAQSGHAGEEERRASPRGTVLNVIGVHLYLERPDGTVLLGLRHPSSVFAPSTWHALAGHCEQENAIACLIREAREEAGLRIERQDVELVHVVHHIDRAGDRPRMGLFFRARSWSGEPELREPDKCTQWKFWDPAALPDDLVPYTRIAIEGIKNGALYSETGWPA
ncbi:methyltransferase, FxLD system [Streptomyces sp. WAC 04229]|uniref:methyltransferase, FxLD system n=1 Tax=Streptomyces sp. WAC 04229 TaxID=2203206 RepID=UPI000F738FCD|nr:methyltransferase, FxLD system [Streptomyces sp. WAC 04229]RSN48241.1 methyltransferase, FxLD system [Streptomyces sp. WAC 04229]